MQVKQRNEIDNRYKWHLEDIFPTNEAWEECFFATEEMIPQISKYNGNLKDDETILLCLSISLLLMAAYNMIGYLFRWKHIYCMHQLSNRRRMTPENIQWEEMTFADAYGIPLVFTIVGLIGIVCYFAI